MNLDSLSLDRWDSKQRDHDSIEDSQIEEETVGFPKYAPASNWWLRHLSCREKVTRAVLPYQAALPTWRSSEMMVVEYEANASSDQPTLILRKRERPVRVPPALPCISALVTVSGS